MKQAQAMQCSVTVNTRTEEEKAVMRAITLPLNSRAEGRVV